MTEPLPILPPGRLTLAFFVDGEPKGQPRPKAFARRFGDKWQARVYDPGTAEGWKSQIAIAAKSHIPAKPMEGPIRLDLEFFFARPKSHYRTGKLSGILRPDPPIWHEVKPDLDNLTKAVKDALTQLRFWRDDSQVCSGHWAKFYVIAGGIPGCLIRVQALSEQSDPRQPTLELTN